MIQYVVNREKRTIVAYFEGQENYWILSLIEMTDKIFGDVPDMADDIMTNAMLSLNGDYTGKAKCSPEDVFDVKYGKQLAKQRLLRKWESVKRQVLKAYIRKIKHESNTLIGRIEKRYY